MGEVDWQSRRSDAGGRCRRRVDTSPSAGELQQWNVRGRRLAVWPMLAALLTVLGLTGTAPSALAAGLGGAGGGERDVRGDRSTTESGERRGGHSTPGTVWRSTGSTASCRWRRAGSGTRTVEYEALALDRVTAGDDRGDTAGGGPARHGIRGRAPVVPGRRGAACERPAAPSGARDERRGRDTA